MQQAEERANTEFVLAIRGDKFTSRTLRYMPKDRTDLETTSAFWTDIDGFSENENQVTSAASQSQ